MLSKFTLRISNTKLSKVYSLPFMKQSEPDVFIAKNLYTRQIWPLKSSMATLVFFIKKKNGFLCLVPDYRNINVIIIKNKYLLLLISKVSSTSWSSTYAGESEAEDGSSDQEDQHTSETAIPGIQVD